MTDLRLLTTSLTAGRSMRSSEAAEAVRILTMPEVAEGEKAAFLTALAHKGETAEELAAFALELRKLARDPGMSEWSPRAIDIVGTGGDHAGGFNVSTVVVLTLASAGVPVMKHGNRGITSKCGSADLLSGLGYQIEATPEKLREGIKELGYVFFFAPVYHPAFKEIGPVRRTLAAQGQRTIFNLLGPLINPGRPARSIIGVFAEAWVPRLAAAADQLGLEAGLAVHGTLGDGRGIDELTTATPNRVRGFGRLRDLDTTWTAENLGLATAPFDDIKGGDVTTNLRMIEDILAGRGPRGLVDTIVLNTAVALWVCGQTTSPGEGIARARDLLLGGAVRAKIAATADFFRS